MGPAELFESNLREITRIVAFVCKRNHLSPTDSDDFRQHVYLKLIENDYAVLRKFEGRSALPTYLMTVIERLFSQYRYQLWGKWRPSAEAKRLGDKAIALERMLTRDGFTLNEAIQSLTTGNNPIYTRAEIEAIYARLPVRQPRTVLVTDQALPEVAAPAAADDGMMHNDRECTARAVEHALDDAILVMEPEDRIILQLRFWHAKKGPDIAAALHIDQKKLYKRIDRLIVNLADQMERAGIRRDDALNLLTHGENLTLHPEKWAPRPSQETDGDLGEGRSRRWDDHDGD